MASQDIINTLVEQVSIAALLYSSNNDPPLAFRATVTRQHYLLTAATALVNALEEPEEEAWRFVLQPCVHACLTSAWECGILDQWLRALMSSKDLASKASADQKLMGDDASAQSLFHFTNNTILELLEWMQTHLGPLASFNAYMAQSVAIERARTGRGFADMYPFESLGNGSSSPDEVVLVDVGGGYGHVIEDIKIHIPELQGKMVLEDLPITLESHVPLENTEIAPYNFLTMEQPIKGARAYLFRHVLHDWPDHMCRQILLNTIPALVAGKSRVLIAEIVLPPTNPPVFRALTDIQMMKYGGSGWKEKEWREIFDSVGRDLVCSEER